MNQELMEIKEIPTACKELMKMGHFQKLGEAGIFAIICKAKVLGMDLMDALSGGLYFVGGKVEMASITMNQIIRRAGHSIRKDEESDNTQCILHGKRADNGDMWTASFTIEEAKRANILKGAWLTYPQDMLFARALSRLARQLFPDVIKGCYVQGEIDPNLDFNKADAIAAVSQETIEICPAIEEKPLPVVITQEQAEELENAYKPYPEWKMNILKVLEKESFMDIAPSKYNWCLKVLEKKLNDVKKEEVEHAAN